MSLNYHKTHTFFVLFSLISSWYYTDLANERRKYDQQLKEAEDSTTTNSVNVRENDASSGATTGSLNINEEDYGINPSMGPMHRLLYLACSKQLEKLYFDDIHVSNEEERERIIYTFVSKVLCHVVGKRKWNKMGHIKHMVNFVHKTDEGLAMLILENSCLKWLDDHQNPNLEAKMKEKARYSEAVGRGKNWSIVGLNRFMEIVTALDKKKSENGESYKSIQQFVLKEERNNNNNSKRKRRNVVSVDESLVGMEANGNSSEEARMLMIEAFLGGAVVPTPQVNIGHTLEHNSMPTLSMAGGNSTATHLSGTENHTQVSYGDVGDNFASVPM